MKSRGAAARARAAGLYAWQLSGDDGRPAAAQLLIQEFGKADSKYFARLLQGTIEHAGALEQLIAPRSDRKPKELSPVERGSAARGVELKNAPDILFRS